MSVSIDKPVPNFDFEATAGLRATLSDLKGQQVVLYFYPKDATPGCTSQAQQFRDHHEQFKALNTVVFGVSRDSLASHQRFKEKQSLPFELISDSDQSLCTLFDVLKEKKNFGKTYMGIERSTFVIDPQGILIVEQRKVKVPGHVAALLDMLEERA